MNSHLNKNIIQMNKIKTFNYNRSIFKTRNSKNMKMNYKNKIFNICSNRIKQQRENSKKNK